MEDPLSNFIKRYSVTQVFLGQEGDITERNDEFFDSNIEISPQNLVLALRKILDFRDDFGEQNLLRYSECLKQILNPLKEDLDGKKIAVYELNNLQNKIIEILFDPRTEVNSFENIMKSFNQVLDSISQIIATTRMNYLLNIQLFLKRIDSKIIDCNLYQNIDKNKFNYQLNFFPFIPKGNEVIESTIIRKTFYYINNSIKTKIENEINRENLLKIVDEYFKFNIFQIDNPIEESKIPVHSPTTFPDYFAIFCLEITNVMIKLEKLNLLKDGDIEEINSKLTSIMIKMDMKTFDHWNAYIASSTLSNDFHNIEGALRSFFTYFLLELKKKEIKEEYFKIVTKKNKRIDLTKIFKLIWEEYPTNFQYVLYEIMRDLKMPVLVSYLYKAMNKKIDYKQIDHMLANRFLELIEKEPIKSILNHFIPTQVNQTKYKNLKTAEEIKNRIITATYSIILMKMPKKLCGFTTNKLNIAIKLYSNELTKNCATFIVYLHEMAHLLRRIHCDTISESSLCRSPDDGINEGGFKLEQDLFGEQIVYITDKSSQFLMDGNFSENIMRFKEEFKNSNNSTKANVRTKLRSSENIQFIGKCGTRIANEGFLKIRKFIEEDMTNQFRS